MATPRKGLRGYRLIILAATGALLVIFGALWISVIFPALDKVPADYENSYQFEGTFSVINPDTLSLDTFPVAQTIVQKAVGTEDGALLVHQVRSITNLATGDDISARYGDDSTLAIDGRTLAFRSDVDERGRAGQWGPPRPLSEGDTYALWHPGAGQSLTATYVRTEDFRGLGVLVFEINGQDINIGTEPQSGLPLLMDTTITQRVEPSSGAVVTNDSLTITSLDLFGEKMELVVSDLRFTEGTIAQMMDTARCASWMLLWFRTLVPWLAIGFGGLLVAGSATTVAVRSAQKARADRRSEHPRPTHA